MPKVNINKSRYRMEFFPAWVKQRMSEKGIKQINIASYMHMSQQSFSKKLLGSSFNMKELMIIFKYLDATDEEILFFFKT